MVNLKLDKKVSAAQISQALSGYQFNMVILKAVIEAADEYEEQLMMLAQ